MNTSAAPSPPSLDSQQVMAKSQSNFSVSFWFISKERRQALTHFYALSRVIDDAVDEHQGAEAERALAFWKQEVELCYVGTPTHPITQAMQQTICRYGIPRKYLDLLIEGCEQDLHPRTIETFEDLYQYCYRVAGVIGLTCMKIFGVEGAEAEQAAEELGIALQLTNILRDVASDARRGRMYLPMEDLRRYRLSVKEVETGPVTPRLRILLKLTADRSELYFNRAFTRMSTLPRRPLRAAWLMGKVYEAILQKIRRCDYGIYSGKIKLSKLEKLRVIGRELVRRG